MLKTNSRKRHLSIVSALLVIAAVLMPVVTFNDVHAGQITNRSLILIPAAEGGGSEPGGTVDHLFEFDLEGGTSVGSIRFTYCTTAAAVPDGIDCDVPIGLDVSGATLETETGATGFSVSEATTNEVVISRASASTTSAGTVTYRLDGIVNPSTANETFYVRINSYTSTSGTGSAVDWGNVAASTAEPIIVSGTMPESLVFCTGRTIGLTGGVPDCTTASDGAVAFDRLFSSTDTATAMSQMSASTNAGLGYAITVNGPTLTSGSNTILPMSDGSNGSTSLILGTSQFGMNLVENVTTTRVNEDPLGLDADPVPNGTNYRGQPDTVYGTPDAFKFANGDVIARSDNGGAGGSDAQIYTASYVVNVPGSQPAGTYTTTLTYICTATF